MDGATDNLGLDGGYALGSFDGSEVGTVGKTVESCVGKVFGTIEG